MVLLLLLWLSVSVCMCMCVCDLLTQQLIVFVYGMELTKGGCGERCKRRSGGGGICGGRSL